MNYLGRARTAAGAPLYEATYELNSALQISVPEFQQLVLTRGHGTARPLSQTRGDIHAPSR